MHRLWPENDRWRMRTLSLPAGGVGEHQLSRKWQRVEWRVVAANMNDYLALRCHGTTTFYEASPRLRGIKQERCLHAQMPAHGGTMLWRKVCFPMAVARKPIIQDGLKQTQGSPRLMEKPKPKKSNGPPRREPPKQSPKLSQAGCVGGRRPCGAAFAGRPAPGSGLGQSHQSVRMLQDMRIFNSVSPRSISSGLIRQMEAKNAAGRCSLLLESGTCSARKPAGPSTN